MKNKVTSIIGLIAAILTVLSAFYTNWTDLHTIEEIFTKIVQLLSSGAIAGLGYLSGRSQDLNNPHA